MKFTKISLVLLFSFILLSAFSLKKEKDGLVYAFGIAASFTDTIVYYTEIQALDSAKLNKHKFLPNRDAYSYQLKNHLEYERNIPNRVCMIYFSNNKKNLEKEATKLLNKYKKNKGITTQRIDVAEFRFKYAGK
jgi:predicted solute-binding protein